VPGLTGSIRRSPPRPIELGAGGDQQFLASLRGLSGQATPMLYGGIYHVAASIEKVQTLVP
jgi:hypothetical protein